MYKTMYFEVCIHSSAVQADEKVTRMPRCCNKSCSAA